MTCKQCTFLQEQGEVSLPTESLDIPLWLQSNGNHILAKCLENEPPMDGFPTCECGKEMSDCSIHPNTPDEWTASMQASLAKILAKLESNQVLVKEQDRGFTEKSCVLLAQLDHDSSSWKMSPLLKATALNKLSKTWPSWGMTVDGCAYEHPMSGHRITETGGSRYAMPTPVVAMEAPNKKSNSKGPKNLVEIAQGQWEQFWPTPTSHNAKEGGYPAEHTRNTPTLSAKAGGKLNPQWVEWLMGWPIDHTASKQLETVKSRSKSQSHLPSWLRG